MKKDTQQKRSILDSKIISLLKQTIRRLSSIEDRLKQVENKLNMSNQHYTNIPLYVHNPAKSGTSACPQCNIDLSTNPVCMSVNCPYACKVTC
jgi:hypothetical protein